MCFLALLPFAIIAGGATGAAGTVPAQFSQLDEQSSQAPADIVELAKSLMGSELTAGILDHAQSFAVPTLGRTLQMHSHSSDDAAHRLPGEFSKDPYGIARLSAGDTHAFLHQQARAPLVVDVGANLGSFTLSAYLTNPGLRILALEPMPATYTFLKWNLRSNNIPEITEEEFHAGKPGVLAMQRAVTSDGRKVQVEYSPSKSMNAITSASTAASQIPTTYDCQERDVVQTSVQSLSLTQFLGSEEAVKFLKIDCEGCEHEVVPLMSSSGMLSRVEMASGEVHPCLSEHSCRYSSDQVATTRSLLNKFGDWSR